MHVAHSLEFDRIVDAVAALAITPLGAVSLDALEPSADPKVVVALQNATANAASNSFAASARTTSLWLPLG